MLQAKQNCWPSCTFEAGLGMWYICLSTSSGMGYLTLKYQLNMHSLVCLWATGPVSAYQCAEAVQAAENSAWFLGWVLCMKSSVRPSSLYTISSTNSLEPKLLKIAQWHFSVLEIYLWWLILLASVVCGIKYPRFFWEQGNMLICLFLSGNIGKYFMRTREQNKFMGTEYGNFENYFWGTWPIIFREGLFSGVALHASR